MAGTGNDSSDGSNPKIRKRQTQSCDRCKFKKRKCDGNNPCGNCIKALADCTMNVEQKKRGPKRNHTDDYENNPTSESPKAFSNANIKKYQPNNIFANDQHTAKIRENNPFDSVFDSNIQFETDFVSNFAIDPSLTLASYVKPSPYNPMGANYSVPQTMQQQPIEIDPVVLNYYTQLNPKLSVQQDLDLFLAATLQNANEEQSSDLTITELPGIPSTFYMHLISMFFTYYHKSNPILQESIFFENLVPRNRHHTMLLNTIYAIGCQYSRSPHLYQTPFYTPAKAFEYFINRALSNTPPPEVWASISANTIEICQASLLLASCDYRLQKSHTWMMFGLSIRQAQKYEMHTASVSHDFLSICNNLPKFHVSCTKQERQR
jgi:hypothetical protein